ncbi:hypothetical protein GORHZ_006_00120 [Gordonia rhizosphera NBRC 16068]|uniref:Uncharacterized protein n=1 Tax=Gordonia rhizosphera NBRC 16068 TaxID=1108045 RepID=K6UXM1_9ACTN|nr:hypothetical protein GORHZ_006_00120 [Gordonia rhizosphera NBRC 16068]
MDLAGLARVARTAIRVDEVWMTGLSIPGLTSIDVFAHLSQNDFMMPALAIAATARLPSYDR